jgi:hypothetical protein
MFLSYTEKVRGFPCGDFAALRESLCAHYNRREVVFVSRSGAPDWG